MAINIEARLLSENATEVVYEYSWNKNDWGRFSIKKQDLGLSIINKAENDNESFYLYRAYSAVKKRLAL